MSSPPLSNERLESIRIDPDRDASTVHRWLTHPKAKYWDMLESSQAQVHDFLADNIREAGDSDHGLRIGYCDSRPEFMFELYDPLTSDLAAPDTGYRHADGDIGMHLLVAPSDHGIPGFTGRVMLHIMRTAFFEVGAARVVVEPDVRNVAVHRLNAAVGFRVAGDYPVADKTARLSYCTRADFVRVTDNGRIPALTAPAAGDAHVR
ncbi:GNAT family N-acetyltransferase [Jongsikchunia kroppenstedtii]|uniref:GNAT family N-acetyltransferase n=1 Tax=Jongsikchunia kroppenstedtii TaxID=1121721 RepID=UPI00035DFC63|nr:GNAT family N-acetyltransferase [Jongsikchunia kroppenstedtii]